MRITARRFLLAWVLGSMLLMMLIGLSSSHNSEFHVATHKPEDRPQEDEDNSESGAGSGDGGGDAEPEETTKAVKKGGKRKKAAQAETTDAPAETGAPAETEPPQETQPAEEIPEPPKTKKGKKADAAGKSKKSKKRKGGGGGALAESGDLAVPAASRPVDPVASDGAQFSHVAVMHTEDGDITLGLRADAAPKTVANFVSLSTDGWYNRSCVYRYEKGFVLQGGSCGGANQRHPAPTVPLEYQLPNARMSISMARTSDPNSASSEWFINLRDNSEGLGPRRKGGYTVFGEVMPAAATANAASMAAIAQMKTRPVAHKKGSISRFEKSPKVWWIEVRSARY